MTCARLGAAEGGTGPEAACPPGSRVADGEAGGFSAVQKLLTNRDSHRLTRSDDSRAMPSAETVTRAHRFERIVTRGGRFPRGRCV